jgi:polyhydroxybutyrate depolymerase
MAQELVEKSFYYDGVKRTYYIYVPGTYQDTVAKVPLILGLHGYGKDGMEMANHYGFMPIADTAGFIAVFPNGTRDNFFNKRFWNFGNVAGSNVDDYGFLLALTDTVVSHLNIDTTRMYVAGMSNGTYMSYYLACGTGRFAAVAGVTGSMSKNMYENCIPLFTVPVMHVHGTKDRVTPFNGNRTSLPVDSLIRFWASVNDCNDAFIIENIPDTDQSDKVSAIKYRTVNPINGHQVVLIKVVGGGHTWPGAKAQSVLSGKVCMDFNVTDEIWKFFRGYKRNVDE